MARNTSGGSNITFEIRGYNRVRNNLRKVVAAHPKETDSVMRTWAKSAADSLKKTPYPSKPSNSRYTRTYELKAGWNAVQLKPGVWSIANNASGHKGGFYARYVVGEKDGPKNQRQAWMHSGRWWRADEVLEEIYIPKLRTGLEEKYVSLWNE